MRGTINWTIAQWLGWTIEEHEIKPGVKLCTFMTPERQRWGYGFKRNTPTEHQMFSYLANDAYSAGYVTNSDLLVHDIKQYRPDVVVRLSSYDSYEASIWYGDHRLGYASSGRSLNGALVKALLMAINSKYLSDRPEEKFPKDIHDLGVLPF